MRAVGIHLNPDLTRDDPPGQSAVAEIAAGGVLVAVRMCRSNAEIVAVVGASPALVLIDAPVVIPATTVGRRDLEHVLTWLDIPAFPVTSERIQKVHGGVRGPLLAAALPSTLVVAESFPDQVLRQLLWERLHPAGSPPLGLADYRTGWIEVRTPTFRPRGGRARNDGIAPTRAILADVLDLAAWPLPERSGDLAALDEAAVIDAVAAAFAAHRCLHAPGDRWVRIGTAERGQVVMPANPDLIARAEVNIARLRDEGTINIPLAVAGRAVGPPQSW